MQKLTRSLIAVGGLAALAACGDDVSIAAPTPAPAAVVTAVTVSPASISIFVGEKVVMTAQVTVSSGTGTPVTTVAWSSANTAIASVNATSGEVTGVAAGTTTIRATAGGITGASSVTVKAPTVSAISVAPSAVTLRNGESVTAVATVTGDPGANTGVTWSTTGTLVTVGATSGVITAVASGTGTAVVTATSNADATKKASLTVTVVAQPVALQSLTLTPTQITLGPGASGSVTAVTQTAAGASVAFANNASAAASGCPGVATASTDAATGATTVTSVASGSCVITVTATGSGSGLQTNSIQATINVTVVTPQISINSITVGNTATPVPVNNVTNQIEVNLNFQPNGVAIDSVVVRINQPDGLRRVALQGFGGAIPAAGILSLSVNTANFVKDMTVPSVTVDLLNGPTTVSAQLYPKGATGSTAANCTNNPSDPTCTSPVAIVLNNMDGWTADITKPSVNANSAAGITYWGGPTANATAYVYPVIYTPGRSVSTVTWLLGGCTADTFGPLLASNNGRTQQGRMQTFGYTANGAGLSCTSYENGGGTRDNVAVAASLDNTNNPYPTGGMIANTVVFGATPDSLRLDYKAPSVSTPSITRTVPAVTGWVNASFSFINFSSTDGGVGLRSTRDRMTSYTSVNCPGVTATDVAMPTGTGADINGTVACPTNFIGGTPGLGGTAPWTVKGTESDRLNNLGTSGSTSTFGTDYTAPSIRWGTLDGTFVDPAPPAGLLASLPVAYGGTVTDPVDSTLFDATVVKAAGVYGEFRAEYLDERSGFYNAGQPSGGAAQTHMLSHAGHLNPVGVCQVGTGTIGATFITNPGCTLVSIATGTLGVRVDGWQPGTRVAVPLPEGYYVYRTNVSDAAGNGATALTRRVLVNNQSPFSTGLGLPAVLTANVFNFGATYADSAELIAHSLQLQYPNFPTVDSVRYNRTSIGTAFDDAITSPLAVNNAPTTGAPYARGIENVTAGVFPASNVGAPGTPLKPISAVAWSWNNGSTFGFGATFPVPGRSPIIPIPGLNVENGSPIATWNSTNPTLSITHFRVITTVATSNQFGSTTPLRAQVVAPTNSPNGPFSRVDFYRLVDATDAVVACGAGTASHYNYLGSAAAASAIGTDQGTYRSWIYALPNASFVNGWNTSTAQTAVAAADCIIAVGVVSTGDGLATAATTMIP